MEWSSNQAAKTAEHRCSPPLAVTAWVEAAASAHHQLLGRLPAASKATTAPGGDIEANRAACDRVGIINRRACSSFDLIHST